jgi:hypothetical protein
MEEFVKWLLDHLDWRLEDLRCGTESGGDAGGEGGGVRWREWK